MAENAANTIAKERVCDLATRNGEPRWLKDLRLNAWEAYLKLPAPNHRHEEWHKTGIEKLDLSQYGLLEESKSAPGKARDKSELVAKSIESAATLTQGYGATGTFVELDAELASKGVIFKSLSSAIEENEDLLKTILTGDKYVPESDKPDKFALLNRALFQGGALLYVPAGVVIDKPFVFNVDMPAVASKLAIFPRVIVILESNAQAQVVTVSGDQAASADGGLFVDMLTEVYLGANARLSAVNVDKLSDTTYQMSKTRTHVERDAHFDYLTCGLGAKQIKSDFETVMAGPGSYSRVQGLVLGSDSEQYSYNTTQAHKTPNASSDIIFRVALKDKAQSIYQGNVLVDKIAQKTSAFQSNKNLLLGQKAKADSIPRLEILADDVKCSHGATVGPVDPEQLFYLQCRGLSVQEAQEFIVSGFFVQVLDTVNITGAAAWIGELVAQKIHS
ncbi:MAG: Fe-S cluster assembly protein SufD [Candidatus Obscuribacterales bacterium]|nr:Fe-S cluster assembly protein SufD [Candidatus Obscuribacterales bacterium]